MLSQNRMAQTGEFEQGLLNDSHRMVSSVLVEVDESMNSLMMFSLSEQERRNGELTGTAELGD